jgi:hypothetical protein
MMDHGAVDSSPSTNRRIVRPDEVEGRAAFEANPENAL